jgi:hypothetical protein
MPLRNRFHRGTERAVVRFPARLEVDRLCLHLLPVIALALISNASAEFTVDELRQQAAETFQRARRSQNACRRCSCGRGMCHFRK